MAVVQRFDNGIPVVLDATLAFYSATIGVAIGRGARDEDGAQRGISHLLEHAVMSAELPGRAGATLTEWADAHGGQANASTALEFVTYWLRVPHEHAAKAARLLADAVADPRLTAALCDAESRVVHAELTAADADPVDRCQTRFFEQLFAGHPLGRPVGGRPETLPRFGPDALAASHTAALTGWPVVVAVVGRAAEERSTFEALAGSRLAGMARCGTRIQRVPPPALPTDLVVSEPDRTGDFCYLTFGGRGDPKGSDESAAMDVLASAVGGTPGSILYSRLRGEGLGYQFQSVARSLSDTGVWRVVAGCANADRAAVIDIVENCLRIVADDQLDDTRFAAAREQAAGSVVIEHEDPVARAYLLTHDLPADIPTNSSRDTDLGFDPVADLVRRVRAVDRDALAAAAERVLSSRVLVREFA
jgi:predicted Zn-dependent peptidase